MAEVCAKTEMMRLILRLYPKWQEGDVWVRLDRDGEVISADAPMPVRRRNVKSHGLLFGHIEEEEHSKYIPYFLSKGPNWDVVGYVFDRFEYEIFRAKVLEEQEKKDA